MRPWLLVVVLASCGPSANYGRGPQAIARWDLEVGRADSAWKAEVTKGRAAATTAWIREQLAEARGATPERAFGIATTLHREALARDLGELDATEIQPVLERAVLALLPRADAAGLLGFRDAPHGTAARAKAAEAFTADIARFEALEETARPRAALLYSSLADYFAFSRPGTGDATARVALASTGWALAPTGCRLIDDALGGPPRGQGDVVARLRVSITSCQDQVLVSETTQIETKQYRALTARGGSQVVSDGSRDQAVTVVDARTGDTVATRVDSAPGPSRVVTTQDAWGTVEGPVPVRHRTLRSAVVGTLSLETADGTIALGTIDVEEVFDRQDWAFSGMNIRETRDTSGQLQREIHGRQGAIATRLRELQPEVTTALTALRTAQFLDHARRADTPDAALEAYLGAVFLAPDNEEAQQWLGAHVEAPPAAITAALHLADHASMDSPLAFALAGPVALTADEIATLAPAEVVPAIRYNDTGAALFELAAGLQQSAPTGIDDPTSRYGGGVGMRYGLELDPGRLSTGLIIGGAGDLRLGYAGGVFFDLSTPAHIGLRTGPFGITATGLVGWSKLGTEGATDLWVRNAPYAGYGLEGSYVSRGSLDLYASYTKIARSQSWQTDRVTTEPQGPLTGDEDRVEVRLLRFNDHNIKTYTLRYTQFGGDQRDGRAITLWLGIAARLD